MVGKSFLATLLLFLVACATPNLWRGGSDEYMQLYDGPRLPSSQVARVRFVEPEFKLLNATPYFTSVSGTKLNDSSEIYGTERFEVLPGRYEIGLNLIFSGSHQDPLDGRWYETGSGSISAFLRAGHQYEVVLSDEGSQVAPPQWPPPGVMPPIRKLHGSLYDRTAAKTIVYHKEMSWDYPQLGRGQTPPEPRRNLFERIDDMPSGTKVTMVQSPSQSGGLNTRVVAPKGVSIPSDAEVVPPKLEFDEDQIRAQASELQLQGEVTVRFDVSEKGKVSNVRIISEAKGETVDAVKEIIVSSTAQPGTVDSKPAAFKDVEAQISFENTGQTGKTLLKIAAVVVLVPIAIILGLASGGGGFSFGD